jgi:hypothetical protein
MKRNSQFIMTKQMQRASWRRSYRRRKKISLWTVNLDRPVEADIRAAEINLFPLTNKK